MSDPTSKSKSRPSRHLHARRHSFLSPTILSPPKATASSSSSPPSSALATSSSAAVAAAGAQEWTLSFEKPDLSQATLPISQLSAQDLQPFLNRDTVFYSLSPELSGIGGKKLAEAIYRNWFPHRGRFEHKYDAQRAEAEGDGDDEGREAGDFVGKFVQLSPWFLRGVDEAGGGNGQGWDTERWVNVLGDVHWGLVAQIGRFMDVDGRGEKPGDVKMPYLNPRDGPVESGSGEESFMAMPTLVESFIILDQDRYQDRDDGQNDEAEEGVVLVWLPNELIDVELERLGGDGNHNVSNVGKWRYTRMDLRKALLVVMAADDPKRRVARIQGSRFWEKHFEKKERSEE